MRFAQHGTAFADVGAFATDMRVMRRGSGHEVGAGYTNLPTVEQGNKVRLLIVTLADPAMQQMDDRFGASSVAIQAKLDMGGHFHRRVSRTSRVKKRKML